MERKFFTTDPNGNFLGYPGGVKSAILGTIEIVALATLISVPIGIGVALWLTEYGKDSWFANVVRYFVDVMTGVPSIVFGLFIYIVLVLGGVGRLVRGLEGLDRAVPADAPDRHTFGRGGAAARARPACARRRWRWARRAGGSSRRVVLPTVPVRAGHGLPARGRPRCRRDRAAAVHGLRWRSALTADLGQPMNALPLQIFGDIKSPRNDVVTRAWGAALTLVVVGPDPQPDRASCFAKESPGMIPPETPRHSTTDARTTNAMTTPQPESTARARQPEHRSAGRAEHERCSGDPRRQASHDHAARPARLLRRARRPSRASTSTSPPNR